MLLTILNDVTKAILKEFDVVAFCASLFYGLLGMLVIMLVNANKRNPYTEDSPFWFSWYHLIKDNLIRVMINIILLAVFIRFSEQLLGKIVTSWISFGLGLGSDVLAKAVQKLAGGFQDWINSSVDKIVTVLTGKKPEPPTS